MGITERMDATTISTTGCRSTPWVRSNATAFINLRAAHLRKDVRGTVCKNGIAY